MEQYWHASSQSLLWVTPGNCGGACGSSADLCHGKTLLVSRCLLHLCSRRLLAHLKLVIDIQMTAALLDCHSHRPGECRRCCWQSSRRDGGWSTEPAPFLPPGTAWGDPALRGAGSCLTCRQRHRRSSVSNAGREQECHTGRLCLPGVQPFSLQQMLPGAFTRAKCSFRHSGQDALLLHHSVCLHTHAHFSVFFFYSKIAGLPAREGGDGAELSVQAGGSVGA